MYDFHTLREKKRPNHSHPPLPGNSCADSPHCGYMGSATAGVWVARTSGLPGCKEAPGLPLGGGSGAPVHAGMGVGACGIGEAPENTGLASVETTNE